MKRNLGLFFAVILLMGLVIVPAVIDNSSYDEEYEDYESDYDEEYSDEEYDEEYDEEPEETVMETYPFTKLQLFSEGRAWVNFDKDGVICTGVIDTNGKLLYQAEGEFYYVSPFKDGLAFYVGNSEEIPPCGIIDLNGNVLFESQDEYSILAYGNGHFLAEQHIQNFDKDEWRLGTIDQNGNILNEMAVTEGSVSDPKDCKYIGENFIALSSTRLYNISTAKISSIVEGNVYDGVIADFQDGYTVATIKGGIFGDELSAGIKVQGTEIKVCSFIDSNVSDEPIYNEGLVWARPYNALVRPDSDKYVDTDTTGYYDKDWNLVISLEEYDHVTGGAFRGGCAAVTMDGADGEFYASVIDKKGNLLYSPVKIDDEETINPNNSANGYFQVTIDSEVKIIGPDGTVYTPEIDDLSALENLTFGDISEGFILMESNGNGTEPGYHYYVSLNGSNIIDSAKLTSEYIDGNSSENDDSEQNSSEEDSTASSYIMPDSYDIIGKWKNIGDKGFGQAQPGAIIIFDGERCNFYSPNDTYAFYNDGNKYVLDVTSPLAESLSFTVNIIDDNNISISGTNLERIE